MTPNSALEVTGLTKTFGRRVAVADLTFAVGPGEIFGILGADGAGKTTTLEMLAGVVKPTSGTRHFAGSPMPRIGFMSAGFSLYPTLSVEENLDFFAAIQHVSKSDRERRKIELLGFSRLDIARRRQAQLLSGGMQKKLALACALIHEPDYLFLDEPTLGVDPVSRRDFWKLLERFTKGGMTIVASTPYMDEAQRFARVAFLDSGRIVALDKPQALRARLASRVFEASGVDAQTVAAAMRDLDQSAQPIGDRIRVVLAKDETIETLGKRIHGVDAPAFVPVEPTLEDVFVEILSGLQLSSIPVRRVEGSQLTKSDAAAIRVDKVTKRFGTFVALREVSLEVRRGEIFGLLGPNGSGKSTLIRILTGISAQTTGSTLVNGLDVRTQPYAVKTSVGYMAQRFSLYRDLTVRENVDLSSGLYGLDSATAATRRDDALKFSGLADKERTRARDLSGGWLQRLALECAIVHHPAIVFLDEPTAGVDPISRRRFWKTIVALAESGTTVLVTTHYMDEAEHCNRVAFLYDGEIVAIGSPRDLKHEVLQDAIAMPTLEDVFVALIERKAVA